MHGWKVRSWEATRSVDEVVGNGEAISRCHRLDLMGHVRVPRKSRNQKFGGERNVEHVLVVTVGDMYFPALEFGWEDNDKGRKHPFRLFRAAKGVRMCEIDLSAVLLFVGQKAGGRSETGKRRRK